MEDLGKYTYEVKKLHSAAWDEIIKEFKDSSIYQTTSYGKIRWGEDSLEHVILMKEGIVVSAVQVIIIKTPILNSGVAYIYRGPLWRKLNTSEDIDHFCKMITVLKHIYVEERNLSLKIIANEINKTNSNIIPTLKTVGYVQQTSALNYRTYILDLSLTIEDLRKNLNKKWRAHLRKAEKNSLKIREGVEEEYFDIFKKLYTEMHSRKKFIEFVSLDQFWDIQNDLTNGLKMKILICENDGEPVSGLMFSALGDTGIPIFSATGDKGLEMRSSYLLRWKMVEQLKNDRIQFLDQGGINPSSNPGGYHFKKGMGGEDIHLVGQFDAYSGLKNYLLFYIGDKVRNEYKNIRKKLKV